MALWHLQAWVSIDASRLDLLGHSSVLFCAAGLEADSASGPAECFELSTRNRVHRHGAGFSFVPYHETGSHRLEAAGWRIQARWPMLGVKSLVTGLQLQSVST